MQKLLLILILAATALHAQKVLAVLEINPGHNDIDLEISEFRHLTDELRTQAREVLPRTKYSILTRDNIFSLLPPDSEQADCLAEACAVEIGRAIGAEYTTQGIIGKFQGMLTLTVELYESMSGNLLGSFVTESKDVMGLLVTIREKAPGLFAKLNADKIENVEFKKVESGELIIENKENLAVEEQKLSDNSQLSTLNPQLEKKSKTPFYIALSLDLIGAAALGFGIYQHFNANSLYDDYEKLPHNDKSALQKANDAQQMRNIGLSVGGALLATGIAVHICF